MRLPLLLGLVLGMRHGADPDHLTAIDGLARIRSSPVNGVLFALGHGLVVTLLSVGIGHMLAGRLEPVGSWMLILLGIVNVWRLIRDRRTASDVPRPIPLAPFLLGMILAAGMETASQLTAVMLAGRANAWLIGAAFTGGMILVDGLDGYLAAKTQSVASSGTANGRAGSRLLGVLVVAVSFGLGTAVPYGNNLDRFALPFGLTLFAAVLGLRLWGRNPDLIPIHRFAFIRRTTSHGPGTEDHSGSTARQ